MSRTVYLVVLIGLVSAAAAAADFATKLPHFRHKRPHEHMPPGEAPRPHWPFPEHKPPHDHKHGPRSKPGPFAQPPRMAGAPDHMPHHHNHHGHHPAGSAHPPMAHTYIHFTTHHFRSTWHRPIRTARALIL
ncbi:early nodulin-75-like [Punica granatum]|uniref:Early nodulin-75-like n=1 Tax=Punica granatum TaxID=22663 RepID=A0A6P8DVK9_PUNGR|nr:early nodulin-75-like [Punica granatum]